MSGLPLNSLWVFNAVVRCGSFRLAAQELCVSESAVSHQIKHLEQWFGRSLFDRTGNRPRLLPVGEELAQGLGEPFLDIAAACRRVQQSSELHTLVIAAIPSLAVCCIIPALAGFRSRYPGVTVRVNYAMHGRDIDFARTDIAFVFARHPPSVKGACCHWFASGSSVPVSSPSLSRELAGADSQEAILDAGLLHDSDIDDWKSWFQLGGMDAGPDLPGPVFEDFNLLRAAVLSGQGVALCPLDIIHADVANNLLVPASDRAINEDCNYYLLQRNSRDPVKSGLINSFREWLNEQLMQPRLS
ncbi:hypothetical protein AB833_19395 [Chromatiales bacterium (ex Bugula neritina AB1)]|nr:hypothetical protein AB833_19395 [Chromatiales bacterium (ex Bugula neritina AB1)]